MAKNYVATCRCEGVEWEWQAASETYGPKEDGFVMIDGEHWGAYTYTKVIFCPWCGTKLPDRPVVEAVPPAKEDWFVIYDVGSCAGADHLNGWSVHDTQEQAESARLEILQKGVALSHEGTAHVFRGFWVSGGVKE